MATPSLPPSSPPPQSASSDALESAGRLVDEHMQADNAQLELSALLKIATHKHINCSGTTDIDYPSLPSALPPLASLPFIGQVTHTPLPYELLQEFNKMQCNCSMGLMPEVRRAWLTVDNTIYLWNYEDGKDLAFFDGLDEVILAAGLVRPREGIFQSHIQFLLVLTTAVEITILGVSFNALPTDACGEMHLQPTPLFHVPSDNIGMVAVTGTPQGRIFLAGKDGCLYEVVYQATDGWFTQKCRKINHSHSMLSFLVPSFLSFSEEDPLVEMIVDDSRHILYTRSSKHTISVYDLGQDGMSLSRISQMRIDEIRSYVLSSLRTNDKSLVEAIVKLAVLPKAESSTLHLVAITSIGLRLYFTTTPDGMVARPSLLALVHVRLSPGFSPSSAAQRPGNVHQALYHKGTLVLAASQTEAKDLLWMVDSDLFPFQTSCMESHVTLPLDGRTWAIHETADPDDPFPSSPFPRPPLVVTQHAQTPRQLVLLTTCGSYLLTKMRPVDQLRHLLEVERGASGEAIQAFFRLHKDTQACAMSLILATGPNQQIAGWATEAFFKHGGEPHFVFPTSLAPSNHLPGSPAMAAGPPHQAGVGVGHTPHLLSSPSPLPHAASPLTPYGAGQRVQSPVALGRAVVGPEVQLSGKHDGLCLYLTRLLRPLWRTPMATIYKPPGDYLNEQFLSHYTPEALAAFAEQMYGLRAFLERNPQLFANQDQIDPNSSPSNVYHRMLNFMRPEGMGTDSPTSVQQSLTRKYKADAYAMEQSSLGTLYQLVVYCCECLSLWKLLCEYQLHLTAKELSNDLKQLLRTATFRTVVVSGRQLTSALISSLLKRHSGDAGLSDTLSTRLREITPNLFSHDDALVSKAQELLTVAAGLQNTMEQVNLLRSSLKHFSQVTHQISLASICSQYQQVAYYEGIVELCACAAVNLDPQGLAMHFYKNGQPSDDVVGHRAFMERQGTYAPLTFTLSQLVAKEDMPSPSLSVPLKPGPPVQKKQEETVDLKKDFTEMLALALRSKDELLHVTLYSWLITAQLSEKLIEVQSPFIENYLNYTASIQKDDLLLLDLLWRYYEKNKIYAGAAKVLDELAHKEDPEVTLDQRVEFVSRAVMCAKSCRLVTSGDTVGELLHELEDKMEVARIQLQISEAMKLLPQSVSVSAALKTLDSKLMDISTLYGDYADVFDLPECKLAIVHCAGHYDPTLVENLWREIVEKEIQKIPLGGHTPSQMHGLRTKLVELGRLYSQSERYFPLAYLVQLLEQSSCQQDWEVGFVHYTLQEVGVSIATLFSLYDRLFKSKDSFWQSVKRPLHLLNVIHSLLSGFVDNPSLVAGFERLSFTSAVQDCLSRYLIELQTMPTDTRGLNQTISNFRALEPQIQRICLR